MGTIVIKRRFLEVVIVWLLARLNHTNKEYIDNHANTQHDILGTVCVPHVI